MSVALRSLLIVAASVAGVGALQAQAAPTLPSDTLEANYAPRSAPGPTPEMAPSLPSDTLEAAAPSKPDSGQQAVPPAASQATYWSPPQPAAARTTATLLSLPSSSSKSPSSPMTLWSITGPPASGRATG